MTAILNTTTKMTRMDRAFGQLAMEFTSEGQLKEARQVLEAYNTLPESSRVRLFDILTAEFTK